MSTDPYAREIGRITDDQGRALIVGVNRGAVTLRTLHAGGAVELGEPQQEELGQLLVAATWQAARDGAALIMTAEIAAEAAPAGAP